MDAGETFHGSVPRYDRHLVVFTDKLDWTRNAEDDNSFLRAFSDKLGLKKSYIARKVKFSTAGAFGVHDDFGSAKQGAFNVALFPDNILFKNMTEEHIDKFVQDVLLDEKQIDGIEQQPIPANLDGSKKCRIFVCTHMTRDARCGNIGPAILKTLQEEVAGRDIAERVHLYGISHVGGHHFAGNVIVYPGGDWYGRMTTDEVPKLLDSIFGSKEVFTSHWRGRMGLIHERQEELFEQWDCGNCSKALDW